MHHPPTTPAFDTTGPLISQQRELAKQPRDYNHNREQHRPRSDLDMKLEDEEHRVTLASCGDLNSLGHVRDHPQCSPLVSMSGGPFLLDDDFASGPNSTSSELAMDDPFSFAPTAGPMGPDDHDLHFSPSYLRNSRQHLSTPARSPYHLPHHPIRALDLSPAHPSINSSLGWEGKQIIDRLYVSSTSPPLMWLQQHNCRCVVVVTSATSASASSPSSTGGELMQITSHSVLIDDREADLEQPSDQSSLKKAASVLHTALWQDPTSSVLLCGRGDEHRRERTDDLVVAVAVACLVLGSKLSLRTAVEQVATVLGSGYVQRMRDGFKRQLMAFDCQGLRCVPTHDFFATPSWNPPSADTTVSSDEQACALTEKRGDDNWPSLEATAPNQMVVLSCTHPALPKEEGEGEEPPPTSSSASSLRPHNAQPSVAAASPGTSSLPASAGVVSPRSGSSPLPTSPNPPDAATVGSPDASSGGAGKRPRAEGEGGKSLQQSSKRSRGPYRCGRCGQPKRGHQCPENNKGQDGPASAQSPAVSTPNANSLPSCPSTPAAVATPAKIEPPPPPPPSADALSSSSSSITTATTSSSLSKLKGATVAGAASSSIAPSSPRSASSPPRPSPPSPTYQELLRMVADLTKERDYYRGRYLSVCQGGAQPSTTDHRSRLSGQPPSLHHPPTASPPPSDFQQRPTSSAAGTPLMQQGLPASSSPSTHSPNHALQQQQQQGMGFDPYNMSPASSRSPYLRHSIAASHSHNRTPSPGRYGGRPFPDSALFFPPSPSHHHTHSLRRTQDVSPPHHFPAAHTTHPTQNPVPISLHHLSAPQLGEMDHRAYPYSHQQQHQQQNPSSPPSPLSLKAPEDFSFWDDFCATTNSSNTN